MIFVVGVAQTYAKSETPEMIVETLGYKARYETTVTAMTESLKETMKRSPLRAGMPPSLVKEFDELVEKSINSVLPKMSWKDAKGDFLAYYTNNYTDAELEELYIFLSSETGRKFMSKISTQADELAVICQKRLAPLRPELQKKLMGWYETHKAEIEAYKTRPNQSGDDNSE